MTKLLDPVCGMIVDEGALRAPGYDDVAFCAPGCRTAFLGDQESYPARLDGAEPMPKQCTCGEEGGHHCGHAHDDRAENESASHTGGSGCCGGHGH